MNTEPRPLLFNTPARIIVERDTCKGYRVVYQDGATTHPLTDYMSEAGALNAKEQILLNDNERFAHPSANYMAMSGDQLCEEYRKLVNPRRGTLQALYNVLSGRWDARIRANIESYRVSRDEAISKAHETNPVWVDTLQCLEHDLKTMPRKDSN